MILFVPHLYVSYRCYLETLMPDLHLRIIGSRLLDINHSPYFFQWKPGNNVRLFNPNSFLPNGLNGATATPVVLWLQLPLSRLGYCDIKFTWWMVQEMFLFGTLFFTCFIPSKFLKQVATIVIATVFFCNSRNWWLHVYNGQYYVLFGFLFSLTACLGIKKQHKHTALLLFPSAALLRPFFVLAMLPWLINSFKKKSTTLLIGGTICIGFLLVSGTFSLWSDYSKAMQIYSTDIVGGTGIKVGSDHRFDTVATEGCVYRTAIFTSPKIAGAGALFSLQHYLNLFGVKKSDPIFFTGLLCIGIIMLLILTKRKNIIADEGSMLLTAFMIYLFSELFTPAYRNPYNLIQYLGIVGVFVHKANWRTILLAVTGLALNHDFPFRFIYQREIGEALLLVAIYSSISINRLTETSTSAKQKTNI